MTKLPLDSIICHDVSKPFPLPDGCIDVAITSPPYWGLRDYGDIETIWGGDIDCEHEWSKKIKRWHSDRGKGPKKEVYNDEYVHKGTKHGFCQKCSAWKGQLGLEPHPQMYINHLIQTFREVKRVLKKTASFYLNLGDTYCGTHGSVYDEKKLDKSKESYAMPYRSRPRPNKSNWLQPKQLMLIPSRVAIALQEDGWILRNDMIWHKPNPMPSSVKDRLNTTYEHIFHFVKYKKYYYNLDAIRIPYKPLNRWGGNLVKIPKITKTDLNNQPYAVQYRERLLQPNIKGKNPGDAIEIWNWRAGMNRDESEIIEIRINLPPQKEFVDYLKPKTKGYEKKLDKLFSETKWRHWIRYDDSGFSFPSITDWTKLKKVLNLDDTFDLTQTETKYNAVISKIEGKNPGDFWDITTKPFKGAHFAVFPPDLILQPLKASCPKGGIVLDPFCGRGTVGKVAKELGLHYILFDIKKEYCEMARRYISDIPKLPKNQTKLKEKI